MNLPTTPKDENAIIGCCLLGGVETAIEAVEITPLEAFSNPVAREVFGIIEGLATANQPINEHTVAKAWLDMVNKPLPMEVIQSVNDVPSASNLRTYVDSVIECWRKRRVISAAYSLWSRAQNDSVKIDDLVAECDAILQAEEIESVETVNGQQASAIMIDDLERRFNLNGSLSGIATGFYRLDNKTDGLQFGEQAVIGARPSMGKTSLGLCLCANAAFKNRIPTLFVSLEMSISALTRRLLSIWSDIPMHEVRRGSYTPQDFKKFTLFSSFLSKSPLQIVNAVRGISVNQLCAAVRRRCRKDGVKLVVIDYLQKIRASQKQEKRTYEVAEVSSALRALAVSTNCAMVTLAQLNRDSEKDKPRVPRLCDLGDSKQIEQDADLVCLIHRDRSDSDGRSELIIAKQRDGDTGCVPLKFNGQFCRFENPIVP